MILEHWTDNNEEKALSDLGFMTWANVTHDYQEGAMGYALQFGMGQLASAGGTTPFGELHGEPRRGALDVQEPPIRQRQRGL